MMHWIFDRATGRLKGFDLASHKLLIDVEAHNETVGTMQHGPYYYGHFGACPPGRYGLASPYENTPPIVSEYQFFIPIVDTNGLWTELGRSDIGLHGGGTGSPRPLDPDWQGAWIPTEGCIRLRNGDLDRVAALAHGGDLFEVV